MENEQTPSKIKISYPTPIKVDGLTTSDPAALGGARLGDPNPDGANDGFVPIPRNKIEDANKLMRSIPMGDLSTRRPSDFKNVIKLNTDKTSMHDPVRDVTPATNVAPAPLAMPPVPGKNPRFINPRQKPQDAWFDAGDNGIEVYPADMLEAASEEEGEPGSSAVNKAIRGGQGINPSYLLQNTQRLLGNINKTSEEDEPTQPLRKPTDLDQHLVTTHFIEFNSTVYPIDQVKDLHLDLHASGEASDHNPEVLRVASINHVLGNKEEELNFLPKTGKLIDFPPAPGEEENWMFPYDIKERFVESPRNRRGL